MAEVTEPAVGNPGIFGKFGKLDNPGILTPFNEVPIELIPLLNAAKSAEKFPELTEPATLGEG
jgi:hypothetical protein